MKKSMFLLLMLFATAAFAGQQCSTCHEGKENHTHSKEEQNLDKTMLEKGYAVLHEGRLYAILIENQYWMKIIKHDYFEMKGGKFLIFKVNMLNTNSIKLDDNLQIIKEKLTTVPCYITLDVTTEKRKVAVDCFPDEAQKDYALPYFEVSSKPSSLD